MGIFLQKLLRALGLKRFKWRYHVDTHMAESLESLALEQACDPDEIAADILAEGIARWEKTKQSFEYWDKLTPRERDVVALICLGYKNKEIGEKLSISVVTVKSHVSNALSKFGVQRRGKIQHLLSEWDFSEWDR